jgi:ankyrin repeat protein
LIYLRRCLPARIRHALAELPETLDETYRWTLREINEADWESAHRLFQFVAVASRPLRVEELAELLAFDFKAGPLPKFHKGWRSENPVHAVLSICPSFLTIVDGGHRVGKVVQFSHFSVKEFLTSTRFAEEGDLISRQYHVWMTAAHTLAAQACLGILLHLDKDVVTRNSLKDFPLAEYAAERWVDHARFEDVSRNLEDGMKQLFDPSEPHLSVSLHYAAAWGLHSIVKFLVIGHLKDVHSRSLIDNATPLHFASRYGHIKVARFLLERGAFVTAKNKDGETPLHVALRGGQVQVACMLLEHSADPTAQNEDGDTPLHVASRDGQVQVARMLFGHGADLTAQNKDWETPLHVALRDGQVQVARMLLEHGADPTAHNEDGDTPLHVASREGQVQVAYVLLEHGADLTAQNEDGETPLHLAWRQGHVEVARFLLERGADVTAQKKDGWTLLHLASQEGHVEVSRMLIEHGADVSAQEEDGWTPLHLASRDGQVEIACMLIKHGAHVSALEEDGWTPLHLAAFNSQVEIARLLIEHGADLTAKNNDRETPLHLVSTPDRDEESPQRCVEVARILFEHSADVTTTNMDRPRWIWGCGTRGLQKFHAFLSNMMPILART